MTLPCLSSPNDSEHYTGVQTLAAGDIIDFAVGPGGDFHCDTTMLDATISGDPAPVGGIAELPDVSGSSTSSYFPLAGLAAAALLALTAGGWYAGRWWGR